MKETTLANGWTQLLNGTELKYDFRGFETSDFCETIKKADEVNEIDIEQWLYLDESDPDYQILSQEDHGICST